MDNRPIGIFDSGMGGLTVRAELKRVLPHESLVYFGDGENVPYGPRPREEIIRFVDEAVGRLIDRSSVKIIVIACNAATGAAIDHLRAKYDIPIIGMEPAVKPAALTTRTGTIGVLATAAAFQGALYKATAARYRNSVRIIETVGEGFVELVENDCEATPEAFGIVRCAVEPMLDAGADRIVLGCTHYPFLVEQIRRVIDEWGSSKTSDANAKNNGNEPENLKCKNVIAGDDLSSVAAKTVHIIDSAAAIARRTEQLLTESNLHTDSHNIPRHQYLSFASDDYIDHMARKGEKVPRL